MFVKLKLLLYFLVVGVLLASCAPLEQLCEPNVSDENSDGARLRKGTGSIYSKLQANQRRMLFGSVIYESGKPVITLSKEDALSLGISEELYDDCSSSISRTKAL